MPGPLASQPRESPTANRRTPLASSASAAPTRSARAEATGSGTGSGSGTGTPGSSSASRVEEQLAKIRLDLSVVRANVRVLNEMLRELTPAHEPPEELDLLFVRCDAASAAA